MSQISNVNTSQVNLPQEPMNTSSVEQSRSSRMSEVVQDVKVENPQPPRVHRSVAGIIGRVALGIVTLGISEAIIAIVNKVRSGGASPAREASTLQEARASNLEQAPERASNLEQAPVNSAKPEQAPDQVGNLKEAKIENPQEAFPKTNAQIADAILEGKPLAPEYETELTEVLSKTKKHAGEYLKLDIAKLSDFPNAAAIRQEIAENLRDLNQDVTPGDFHDIVRDAINNNIPDLLIDGLAEKHGVSKEILLAYDKQFPQALVVELNTYEEQYFGRSVGFEHFNETVIDNAFRRRINLDVCKSLQANVEKGVQTLRTGIENFARENNIKLDEQIVEHAIHELKEELFHSYSELSYSRSNVQERVNNAVEKQLANARKALKP